MKETSDSQSSNNAGPPKDKQNSSVELKQGRYDRANSEESVVLALNKNDPFIGQTVAERYQIISIIGRGGMGVVYKAKHKSLDRVVAVKMLHSHLVSDEEAFKRFHREATVVSRVKHPHTITLYDFGITKTGQPFIVMDYIQGTSLKDILKKNGPLSLEEADHIFAQVIEALSCAHDRGVIHRDLKPENIMLTERNGDKHWVELVDFGISKLWTQENHTLNKITRFGDVCGSPPYMSPEQCLSSNNIDARSDIYSLAVVLYESITGNLPYQAKSIIEMLDCHLYSPPTSIKVANPDLGMCDRINAVIMRALEKEPDRRYQTMLQLGQDLKGAIGQDAIKASYAKRPELSSFQNLIGTANEASEADSGTRVMNRVQVKSKKGFFAWHSFAHFIECLVRFFTGTGADNLADKRVLTNCLYCGHLVEPNIRFCLNCGRHLASAQTFTRLRRALGIFHYPRSHRNDEEQGTRQFSARSKSLTTGGSWLKSPIFIAVNLLVLVIVLFLASGGNLLGLGDANQLKQLGIKKHK